MMKAAAIAVSMLVLAGCGGGGTYLGIQPRPIPPVEEIWKADFGEAPRDVLALVKPVMDRSLFDPFTAVYRVDSPPAKMWVYPSQADIRAYGYGTCVGINAKNRMGGYVGFKSHFFVIKNDAVIFGPDDLTSTQFCLGDQYRYRSSYTEGALRTVPASSDQSK